jgi:hypothetical protein
MRRVKSPLNRPASALAISRWPRAHYPELSLSEVRHGVLPLPSSYLNPMFEALSDAGLPA